VGKSSEPGRRISAETISTYLLRASGEKATPEQKAFVFSITFSMGTALRTCDRGRRSSGEDAQRCSRGAGQTAGQAIVGALP